MVSSFHENNEYIESNLFDKCYEHVSVPARWKMWVSALYSISWKRKKIIFCNQHIIDLKKGTSKRFISTSPAIEQI